MRLYLLQTSSIVNMARSYFMLASCVLLFVAACSAADECGPNEELVDCPLALCRNFDCKTKGANPPCPAIAPPCGKGCICKYGYLKDDNGVCVPEEECKPSPCSPHEVWSNCTQAECRPKTCEESGKSIPCPAIADGDCIPGCVCAPDWVRVAVTDLGCIPENECKYWKDGQYIGPVNLDTSRM